MEIAGTVNEEEEDAAVEAAVTHAPRPLATAAAIVIVTLDLAVSSILMSRPAHTEAAVQLDRLPTLALAAAPLPGPVHPLDVAATVGAGHPTADLDPAPVPPPTEAAEKTEDAVRTMVIATDPSSAVNHTAHFTPDEAEPERVLPPEA